MKCANCNQKECYKGKDCTNITESVKDAYNEEALKSLKVATAIESRYYMQKNRIQELIIYAKEMGYTKLGVAFCIGLQTEAELICDVLSKHFTVSSVCCKVCGIDKSYFELERLHTRVEIDTESEVEAMCNPIGQATILNKDHTDLNIILGLCIGHDILFTNHSDAPVTTLAVKDRVLAHNPLGAIYSRYHLNML